MADMVDPESVVLRAPRRVLGRGLAVVGSGLVLLALAAAALLSRQWVQGAPVLGVWGALLAIFGAHQIVLTLRGFTAAGRDGVRYRRLGREKTVPWAEFNRFATAPARWGRTVCAIHRDGRSVTLAVPRGRRTDDSDFDEQVAALRDVAMRFQTDEQTGSSTEILDRRLSWSPVARSVIGLALLGLVLLVSGIGGVLFGQPMMFTMVIIGMLAWSGAFFIGFATVRARTRIEERGLVNRALWQTTVIPWADIDTVRIEMMQANRIVRISRGDGQSTILAALRDGPNYPDPRFDATVAEIRSRADAAKPDPEARARVERPADEAHREARGYPLSLRPPRLPLLFAVPAAVAATGGLVLLMPGRGVYIYVIIALIIVFVRSTLIMIFGWTEVDAGGITNRGILRRRRTSWREAESLSVLTTLFGRAVLVTRKSDNLPDALSAPREGLLARRSDFDHALAEMKVQAGAHGVSVHPGMSRRALWVVFAVLILFAGSLSAALDQPWKRPWWPWLHEASELSQPCALDEAEALVDAPLDETVRDRLAYQAWTCEWDESGEFARLRVEYELHEHHANRSGTDRARDVMESRRDFVVDRPGETSEPKLGEGAVGTREQFGAEAEATQVIVVAREANAVVEVSYTAVGSSDAVEGDAQAVTRAALDRVRPD